MFFSQGLSALYMRSYRTMHTSIKNNAVTGSMLAVVFVLVPTVYAEEDTDLFLRASSSVLLRRASSTQENLKVVDGVYNHTASTPHATPQSRLPFTLQMLLKSLGTVDESYTKEDEVVTSLTMASVRVAKANEYVSYVFTAFAKAK